MYDISRKCINLDKTLNEIELIKEININDFKNVKKIENYIKEHLDKNIEVMYKDFAIKTFLLRSYCNIDLILDLNKIFNTKGVKELLEFYKLNEIWNINQNSHKYMFGHTIEELKRFNNKDLSLEDRINIKEHLVEIKPTNDENKNDIDNFFNKYNFIESVKKIDYDYKINILINKENPSTLSDYTKINDLFIRYPKLYSIHYLENKLKIVYNNITYLI